jgi:hypothetical protein
MDEIKDAMHQMIDSKTSASFVAAWTAFAGWFDLSNIAVACSILLTLVMLARQIIGLRKDLKGRKK